MPYWLQAPSESRIRELEESLAVMREKVRSHGLSLERLGIELSSEREAHAATSEELAALHSTATQERKAWKADKAMLLCERDGALSQVQIISNFPLHSLNGWYYSFRVGVPNSFCMNWGPKLVLHELGSQTRSA